MSTTRPCPFCAEPVQLDAKKCRHCHEFLDGDGPAPQAKGGGSVVLIVLVVAGIGLFCLISIIAAIAIPNLIEARKAGNEASAIGSLKTICTAETMYQQSDKDNDGRLNYGTLADLGKTQLIDMVLASGKKSGYVFACQPGSDPLFLYAATASPLTPGTTGDRFFGIDQAGAIFYSPTTPFGIGPDGLVRPPDAVPVGR